MQLEEEVLKKLVSGTKLSEVYETGVKFVKDQKPAMLSHLTKNFGFAMGIEFRESSLLLGPKTNAIAKKGMVFNVNVGLSGLNNPDAKDKEGKTYALFIGDTIIVNEVNYLSLSYYLYLAILKKFRFILFHSRFYFSFKKIFYPHFLFIFIYIFHLHFLFYFIF